MADTDSDATVDFIESECEDPSCLACSIVGYYGPVYQDGKEGRFVIGMGPSKFVIKDTKFGTAEWFSNTMEDQEKANEAAELVAVEQHGYIPYGDVPCNLYAIADGLADAYEMLCTRAICEQEATESDPQYVYKMDWTVYSFQVRPGEVILIHRVHRDAYSFPVQCMDALLISKCMTPILRNLKSYPPNVGIVQGVLQMKLNRALDARRKRNKNQRDASVTMRTVGNELVIMRMNKYGTLEQKRRKIDPNMDIDVLHSAMEWVNGKYTTTRVPPSFNSLLREIRTNYWGLNPKKR